MQSVNTDRRVRLTLTIALTVLFVAPVFGQTHRGTISGEQGKIMIDFNARFALYAAQHGTGLESSDPRRLVYETRISPEIVQNVGISEESISNRVELRLRAANVTPTFKRNLHPNFLRVIIGGEGRSFYMSIEFVRSNGFYLVEPDPDTDNRSPVVYRKSTVTWSNEFVGNHGNDPAFLFLSLEDGLTEFLNEYLKANQP